ncbi:hypothetical protein EV401DRAFT_1172067 [Pisolithus croceorrhizus]|nr:hypothetical protein EV401DRAFT_1172067 [Pisolithus croceorrhizus]
MSSNESQASSTDSLDASLRADFIVMDALLYDLQLLRNRLASYYSDSTLLANDGTSSSDSWIPPPSHDTPIDASLTSWKDDSSPEHYQGPTTASFTLGGAARQTTTVDNQVNNSVGRLSFRCFYRRADGAACLDWIEYCDVPEHFKEVHNIRNLGRSFPLFCEWEGCGRKVTRHNFVRHVREHHFKQGRTSAHKCSAGHTHGHNSGG